jgi:hypothetical protein
MNFVPVLLYYEGVHVRKQKMLVGVYESNWLAITYNTKRCANILQQLEELTVSPDSCTIIKNKSAFCKYFCMCVD